MLIATKHGDSSEPYNEEIYTLMHAQSCTLEDRQPFIMAIMRAVKINL